MTGRVSRLLAQVKERLGPLAWGTALVFIIARCGDVAMFTHKVFLGRVLPDVSFGAVEPVFSVLAILALPITVIFQIAVKSISRLRMLGEDAKCRSLMRDLVKVSCIGSLLAVVVIWGMRAYLLRRLHLEGNGFVVLLAALFVMVWWKPTYRSILQGTLNYRLLSIPSLFEPVLVLAFTILFVGVCSLGLHGALLSWAGSGLLMAALVLFLLRSLFRGDGESYAGERREMWKMVLPMSVFACSMALLQHFDRLFVRNFLLEHSGGYGAIVTLGMVTSYAVAPIVFVVFPLAAAEHAARRDILRLRRQAVSLGLAVTFVASAFLAVAARPLFRLWNPAFLPYADSVWLYALGIGIQGNIRVLLCVELARHRYSSLMVSFIPSLFVCGVLYISRDAMTVGAVILYFAIARGLILAGLWLSATSGDARADREIVSA